MENYQDVIAKYKDADLDGLTEEEYKELKAAELADMQSYVDAITESKVPEVMYRIGRPITDLKMMLESGVGAFGDKVLYHQIMPGDDHFTEFTYGGVRDDVRGLGTALLGLGLNYLDDILHFHGLQFQVIYFGAYHSERVRKVISGLLDWPVLEVQRPC